MQCSPENSYVLKKKNKYKTQFTINTPIIKMLKKRSNINNNLSCKKHRTHILDLSFRRNNLKIGLSALSKKPPWLLHDLKNFWNFLQLFKILIISPGFSGSPGLSEPCSRPNKFSINIFTWSLPIKMRNEKARTEDSNNTHKKFKKIL